MKITESQLNEAKNTLLKRSLSADAKSEMLKNIYNSTEPVTQSGIISPWSKYFMFFQQKSFVMAAALILMLTSTTYASAVSLPGDFLYPVKTDFIEPLVLTFKITPESKAKYQEKLAQKRILEQEKSTLIASEKIHLNATISTSTNESDVSETTPTTTRKVRVVTDNAEVNISLTSPQNSTSSDITINNSTNTKVMLNKEINLDDTVNDLLEKENEIKDTVKEVVKEKEVEVKETVTEVLDKVDAEVKVEVKGVLGL